MTAATRNGTATDNAWLVTLQQLGFWALHASSVPNELYCMQRMLHIAGYFAHPDMPTASHDVMEVSMRMHAQ